MTTTTATTDLDFDPACSCRRCGKCDQALGELTAAREELAKTRAELAAVTRERHQAIDLLRTIWYGTVNAPARERWLRLIADVNPATTAEPADDDELVPHVEPVSAATIAGMAAMSQVRNREVFAPWDDDEPADEPKATCGHPYIGNEGEFTCDLYAPHNGKQHWNSLAEFAWTDERAA